MEQGQRKVVLIVAVARNGVIGRENDLVWRLKEDMAFFKQTTKGKAVITGRLNYESIPERFRPLPGRQNLVVTRNPDYKAPGAQVVGSIEAALAAAKGEEVFLIGGGQIYRQALSAGLVDMAYVTHVDAEPEGDTHFPLGAFERGWSAEELLRHAPDEENEHGFKIVRYTFLGRAGGVYLRGHG